VGRKNPHTLQVGMQGSVTILKTIWRLLEKLNIDLPYDPAVTLPRDIPKGVLLKLLHRHLHTHVYCNTIHNSQDMEIAKMPHY
jgi:hypothetical protein